MPVLVQRPAGNMNKPRHLTSLHHPVRLPEQPIPEGVIRDNYAYFQYHLVEFVTEHLLDLAQAFKGDLQQVMILAMIGQMLLNHGSAAWPDKGQATKGISASRISDVTSIPRQTVRRKLEALQARGWIERCPDRTWRLVVRDGRSPAADGLAEIDARGMHRGLRLVHAFMKRL